MKKLMIAAMAAMCCLTQLQAQNTVQPQLAGPAGTTIQQSCNVDQLPSIEVRGKAEVKVAPDELSLSIRIDEQNYKGKYTLEEKQDEMVRILQRYGVNIEEDLKVGFMGSDVKLGLFRSQLKSLASATYILKLDSVGKMQQVIDALGKSGISDVKLVKTAYSKKNELEMQLAVEAVKDAKARAVVLSKALGQELGIALQIYVRPMWSNDPTPRYRSGAFMAKNAGAEEEMADGAVAPSAASMMSVTEITFSVEVTAKFELKR